MALNPQRTVMGMAPATRIRPCMWRPCLQLWCQLSGIRNIGPTGIAAGAAKGYGQSGAFRSIR